MGGNSCVDGALRFSREHSRPASEPTGIRNSDFNTFPGLCRLRYIPLPAFRLLMFTPMQDTVCSNLSTFTAVWVGDLGMAVEYMLRKHFGAEFGLGYNLKEFCRN